MCVYYEGRAQGVGFGGRPLASMRCTPTFRYSYVEKAEFKKQLLETPGVPTGEVLHIVRTNEHRCFDVYAREVGAIHMK